MEGLLVNWATSLGKGNGGDPEVVGGEFLARAFTSDALHSALPCPGRSGGAVGPSSIRAGNRHAIGITVNKLYIDVRSLCKRLLLGAGTEVDHIRGIVEIIDIVGKEGASLLVVGSGHPVDQLMNLNLVEKRHILASVGRHLGGLDIIAGEVAEQRTLHPPLCISRGIGGKVTEFRRDLLAKSHHGVLTVELRTFDDEVDQQSAGVLDNLGLIGGHAQIVGGSEALVVDHECELCRLGCLDLLLGQGIVADHVALHEIVKVEHRRRINGQLHGCELAANLGTREGIGEAEYAAEGIDFRLDRGCITRWDEEHCRLSLTLRCEAPA